MNSKSFKILIGCTGSVASIKIPILVQKVLTLNSEAHKIEVKIVTTEHALHFFDISTIPSDVTLHRDLDEWGWSKINDPVLHIELRRWADLFLIAPLDANSMGKIVNGICDNLLTCVARAWDTSKPFLFCPAMNTFMWEHPITSVQIGKLKSYGYHEIPCISKKLACGDEGFGAMAEVDEIVKQVSLKLNLQ